MSLIDCCILCWLDSDWTSFSLSISILLSLFVINLNVFTNFIDTCCWYLTKSVSSDAKCVFTMLNYLLHGVSCGFYFFHGCHKIYFVIPRSIKKNKFNTRICESETVILRTRIGWMLDTNRLCPNTTCTYFKCPTLPITKKHRKRNSLKI
jgi:hypothetical protein